VARGSVFRLLSSVFRPHGVSIYAPVGADLRAAPPKTAILAAI